MKKIYTLLSFVFFTTTAFCQLHGNEWIPFSIASPYSSQQYLKIQVWREGIHRLSYNDIIQNLPDIVTNNVNPKRFQIFHKGVEQSIYVFDESDNVFNTTDYIEFYAKPNDGSYDTQLYDSAQFQLNPFYSLFNDTAAYFFTYAANPVGKRMILDIDTSFPNYPLANYIIKDAWIDYHDEYCDAADYAGTQHNDASYTNGEGFTKAFFGAGGSQSLILPTPNPSNYPLAPLPHATTILMGKNNDGSWRNWTINVNGTSQSFSYYGLAVNRFDADLAANSLSSGNATFQFTNTTPGLNELNTIPYIRIIYPHTLDFVNEPAVFQKFTVKADASLNKTRLDIFNFPPSPTAHWLYVFSNDTIRKVNVDGSGNSYQTLAPTFQSDKECVLTTDGATLTTGHSIAPVTNHSADPLDFAKFTNYMFNSGNLPEYDFLIVTHNSLWTTSVDYKNYRNSIAGGAYKVLLADVNELYDQFAYGINKDPLSIRNFCKFALDTFSVDPAQTRYLFLIGKSTHPDLERACLANPNCPGPSKALYTSLSMVPTYGEPPSDMMLTSRYDPAADSIFRPAFATGRLPAWNPQDVSDYLQKIKDHDDLLTKPPQPWMKQVLHFGGGSDYNEQLGIANHLNEYKKIIEDTLFAGHVTSFFKTSTDPIQANQSAFLQNLIDTGVTIMTFFSHAAGSSFDITTDVPGNYNNPGRYPVIIANSCYIGDIHTIEKQASEQFVLISNKGAIGFIASPNVGYVFEQPVYTIPLYKNIAYYDYGKSIGKCMKDAIDSTINLAPSNRKSITMGMTLNGDPSLRFYNFDKPDLVVTPPGVFFTPANVTTELSSFKINVVVRNIGRSIGKDYYLRVTRKYPDGGTNRIFDTLIKTMPFIDTISIDIPMDFARASGLNKFDVMADASQPQLIDELNENNNSANEVPLMITSSDITPVYPFKYAIIPNPTVKLKASTANLFAPLTTYRFEIDTADRFTSISKKTIDISSVGGIVSWHLTDPLIANRVYYWRVANKAVLTDTVHYHWKESSFIYIPGKTGWSQAHYSQFKEDQFRNVVYTNNMQPADTTFKFVKIASTILCHASYTPDQLGGHPVDYYINNLLQASGGCAYNQFNLAILDSLTLEPWRADLTKHDLYNINKFDPASQSCPIVPNCCSGYAPAYFLYPSWGDSTNFSRYTDSLSMAITNKVPDGNYILLYLLGGSRRSGWHPNLDAVFSSLAPSQVPNPADYQPFIYFTKKGSGIATILYVDSINNRDITFDTIIGGNWDKGFITSVTIGPATHWSELHWGQHSLETSTTYDSIDVSVIGIDTLQHETTLIANLPKSIPDSVLSSIVDAHIYPYLKLQAYVQDTVSTNPPQLDRWQIYYDEVPEAALAPNKWFQPNPFTATVEEGAQISLEMAVENISSRNFTDSMLVDFYVYDKNHVRTNISSPRYKKLLVDSTIIAKVSFDSKNFTGLNSLWIEANPHNDQPEQYHFNNLAELLFNVNRDITNPILDVTFDGQHILDGDIVSAKPFIFIKVKDENKFVAMNDTSKFPVKIIDPDGKVSRVYFETAPNISTDPNKLKWTPATLDGSSKPDNSFKIEYSPAFLVDGVYQLEVQGSDEAGNYSGAYAYRISFEVINRSTITDFINYPNPFSTSTKFVFTLTGSEIPTYLKIQIMTVSGKIVREITQSEIGSIHIGRNMTEYAWDGKDEFGDKLANGIYLYRVITQLNGQTIEHRQTDADHFFKKGWGKMCLIR